MKEAKIKNLFDEFPHAFLTLLTVTTFMLTFVGQLFDQLLLGHCGFQVVVTLPFILDCGIEDLLFG